MEKRPNATPKKIMMVSGVSAKKAKVESGWRQIPAEVNLPAVVDKLRQIDARNQRMHTLSKASADGGRPREDQGYVPEAQRFMDRALAKCLNKKEEEYIRAAVREVMQKAACSPVAVAFDDMPVPLLPRERQANLNLLLGQGVLRLKGNQLDLADERSQKQNPPPQAAKKVPAAIRKNPRDALLSENVLKKQNPLLKAAAKEKPLKESEAAPELIVGTCQELEKAYFRLTVQPNPENVRPEAVLRQAFAFVTAKYRRGAEDHFYLLDQLRSIRQDLLVQSIQSEFAAQVYEANFELALEHGDKLQMSECLSQLLVLYHAGIEGRKDAFILYRLIHLVLESSAEEVQRFLREAGAGFLRSQAFGLGKKLIEALNNCDFCWVFRYMRQGTNVPVRMLLRLFADKLRILRLRVLSATLTK